MHQVDHGVPFAILTMITITIELHCMRSPYLYHHFFLDDNLKALN